MDIYLTLDFELFLGDRSGSVDKCLLETMERLAETAEACGARYTLFVDATYLLRLRELSTAHKELAEDYRKVSDTLRGLSSKGHDIELHIHSQWAYSTYENGEWLLDQEHYKLSDIDRRTAHRLFAEGCSLLKEITGKSPVAFRAGGFSAQPTSLLNELLSANGIKIDSSVYAGNSYHSPQQDYDYTTAPIGRPYRFAEDINVPDAEGAVTELPISYHPVSPLYYWRLVFQRLSKRKCHRRLGDGISVKTAGSSIRRRLTRRTNGFATIDESKISYLWDAYKAAKKRGDEMLCVIGHPKLATEYSLKSLPTILRRMKEDGAVFKTIEDL